MTDGSSSPEPSPSDGVVAQFRIAEDIAARIASGEPVGGACRAAARAFGVSDMSVKRLWKAVRHTPKEYWGIALAPPSHEGAPARAAQAPGRVGALDVSRVLWMAGGTLPTFLEVEGQKLVLLAHEDYAELVAARSKVLLDALKPPRTETPRPPRLGLSTIERDPEVADFLRERFRGGVTADQLRAACVEAFGAERTPSIERITRFRLAARRAR